MRTIGLVVLLLAGCAAPTVKEISEKEPLVSAEWRGDQKAAIRCIVEYLDALQANSTVRDYGTSAQVLWNFPGPFHTIRQLAVFEIKPGRVEMRIAADLSDPEKARQGWERRIASCQ